MLRRTIVVLLVALAWPAAAEAQPLSLLLVQSSASDTAIEVSGGSAGTARVQISVPAGFTLNLARPVGAKIGRASLQLASAVDPTGSGASAEGDVVVADPASFAGNARLRACAPGTHTAVWRLEPLDVPIFVDPVAGPDGALGGYDLRVCFDLRPGLSFAELDLDLERTVVPPRSTGIYVWRAFVTPLTAGGAIDEGATYEARSLVPWPIVLSLHARRAKGKPRGRYVLSGRLVLAGKPRAHATIRLVRVALGEGDSLTFTVGTAKAAETNGGGRFQMVVRVKRRTFFLVYWLAVPRERCSLPSSAPGGCVSETTSPALSDPVSVRP